ncbi:ammonium transporter [Azospirillum halopraeferens]|uniref:ammonium transporter n=1 Tax=Azospirillum halopraeferens TaxID=34010 RepID=UPI000402EB45|nr:ammonium transporter [Azospirillum halopraeferens]
MALTLPDLLWVATATGLVLIMQAGFLCLETGLTRSKNSINVAMKNVVDFVVSVLAFWAVGYGMMFGRSYGGWLGTSGYFLDTGDSGLSIFFLFQAMFCATAVTIVSGAVAERMTFAGYIAVSLLVAALIYPFFGHLAWNGLERGVMHGWLGADGYVDWAGSSAVHQLGGWVALALLLVVGPRMGRFDPQTGQARPVPGSNLPLAALGVLLLCFGWIGFNGGTTLRLDDRIGRIVANTCLAAASGGVAALAAAWIHARKAEVTALLNGVLSGLVAITASCHAVSFPSALIIGAVAGLVGIALERVLLRFGIDDAVGAVPVHLGAGVWGILGVALFGRPELLDTGLTFWPQLAIQVKGLAVCFVVAFVVPYALLWLLARTMRLRVLPQHEEVGLNVSEHGAKTEMHDLYEVLHEQARTGDLSLRVPVDPFTDTARVAARYNHVMDRLEEAVARTEAIVRTANDAIVIFSAEGRVLFHNTLAEWMFGRDAAAFPHLCAADLADGLETAGADHTLFETTGRHAAGRRFPVEVTSATAASRFGRLHILTFRDITERKRAEAELRESETRFRTVFNEAAFGMLMLGETGAVLDANATFLRMIAHEGAHSAPSHPPVPEGGLAGIVHADDLPNVRCAVAEVAAGRALKGTVEARLVCADRHIIWTRLSLTHARLAGHAAPVALAVAEDITAARRDARALNLAASVFANTREAIAIFDSTGGIETVNAAFRTVMGYSAREARGQSLAHLCSGRYGRAEYDAIGAALDAGGSWQGELLIRSKDQTLLPMWVSISAVRDPAGAVTHRVALFTDLSERKQQEEAIWRHANFDAVTGLPNRRLFLDRLSRAIEQAGRDGRQVGLMFLDLDRFKDVNDTLGHKAGDELLVRVADAVRGCVRSSDTVARLGGDEFTVLLTNLTDAAALDHVARKIVAAVARPVVLEGGEVQVSTSVGAALFPEHADDADDLLRKADAALYQAKTRGRNTHQLFTEELDRHTRQRRDFETRFARALQEGELFMVYQPQVDLATRTVFGVEALVRWRSPDHGLVGPDVFVGLAEELGLAIRLGTYVIHRVCADVARLDARGMGHLRVSVNVSVKQLADGAALEETLVAACREHGIDPDRLTVELTENSLLASEDRAVPLLERLNARGIAVALDDFGKGYSSLSRLKRLPVQEIKIDREFVEALPDDEDDRVLVAAMIAMARSMEIDVVAEGVETEDQAACLEALGCAKAQGYLFGRPMPPEEIAALPAAAPSLPAAPAGGRRTALPLATPGA